MTNETFFETDRLIGRLHRAVMAKGADKDTHFRCLINATLPSGVVVDSIQATISFDTGEPLFRCNVQDSPEFILLSKGNGNADDQTLRALIGAVDKLAPALPKDRLGNTLNEGDLVVFLRRMGPMSTDSCTARINIVFTPGMSRAKLFLSDVRDELGFPVSADSIPSYKYSDSCVKVCDPMR